MATVAPRNATRKSKQARSCKILLPLLPNEPSVGILRLTEGKKSDDYAVWTLPGRNGDGQRGYRMLKCGSPDNDAYDIELTNDGYSCECRGFLRRHHCKRGACLSKLLEIGKLS